MVNFTIDLGMAINPGNSGGPIFDMKARVVGVVVAKFTKEESMALVIPATDLVEAMGKAGRQTTEEVSRVASFHRSYVAFNGVYGTVGVYETGLSGAGQAMLEARQAQDVNTGLRMFSQTYDPKIARANEVLTEDLVPNLSAIIRDRSQSIIWDKQHPVLTRKDFMGAHEWCLWLEKRAAHQYFGPANATDLWAIKKVNPQSMIHLTEKPVELASRALQYSSRPGENVIDLFGGSGSTLHCC